MTLPMSALNTRTDSVRCLLEIAAGMGFRLKANPYQASNRPRIVTQENHNV